MNLVDIYEIHCHKIRISISDLKPPSVSLNNLWHQIWQMKHGSFDKHPMDIAATIKKTQITKVTATRSTTDPHGYYSSSTQEPITAQDTVKKLLTDKTEQRIRLLNTTRQAI